MRRTVIKKKILTGDTPDISTAFSKIIGTQIDIEIAYPRYKEYKRLCDSCVTAFQCLVRILGPAYDTEKIEIASWLGAITLETEKYFSPDSHRFPLIEAIFAQGKLHLIDETALGPEVETELRAFSELYPALKQASFIKQFIQICDQLIVYKRHYEKLENLNTNFAKAMVEPAWRPFSFFTQLDIKELLCSGKKSAVELVVTFLHQVFTCTFEIFQLHDSPDVDVDKFIKIFYSAFEKIKKLPELSRCQEAFRVLEGSVELLRKNFTHYYKAFVTAGDSSVILDHFVNDILHNTKNVNATTALQFQKILRFFREKVVHQVKDPQMKQWLTKFTKISEEMKPYTENIRAAAAGANADDNADVDDSVTFDGDLVDFDELMKKLKNLSAGDGGED